MVRVVSNSDSPDELLEHVTFVRALARSLLRDESDADDAAQDTYLAAVRSPPRKRTGIHGVFDLCLGR